MRQLAALLVASALGNLAVSAALSGQENGGEARGQDTQSIARVSLWSGMGLTHLSADAAAPGSWIEIGAEWRMSRLLGFGVSANYGGIDERNQCNRGGIVIDCLNRVGVISGVVGPRVYAFRNRAGAIYGVGLIGFQSSGLGRFGELGYGVLINLWAKTALAIEAGHRYGWPEQGGTGQVWKLRFVRNLGESGGR